MYNGVGQVLPDWSTMGTVRRLEAELSGFKYAGPGFYLTKEDTLLLVPMRRGRDDAWYSTAGDEEEFMAYVWNVPFTRMVFGGDRPPPVRQDDR